MEKAIEGGSGGETFFAASAAFLGIYAFQMFEDAIQATSRLLTSAMSEVYQYSRSLVDASSSIYANHQPRVHHIVPWGDFSNRRAHSLIRDMQNILKEVEIDPRTDPLNLVVISQGYHAPLHKDSYFKSLHSALNSARGDREEVEKVLFYARIFIAFSDPYAKDFRRIFYA